MNKAVFLDRDGTVIKDCGYLDTVEGIELLPGAADALKALVNAGFKLVLITNQSGVGRGLFELEMVHAQHERLAGLLKPHGVGFELIKICPHAPDDGCACRKPEPRMVLEAADELDVDPTRSWMIGDKPSDVLAGKAAGCRTIILGPAKCDEAHHRSADLVAATKVILANDG